MKYFIIMLLCTAKKAYHKQTALKHYKCTEASSYLFYVKSIYNVPSNLSQLYFKLACITQSLPAYKALYYPSFLIYRLLLAYKVLLTWVQKDIQIYRYTYKCTHTFWKAISVNQACPQPAFGQPWVCTWFKKPSYLATSTGSGVSWGRKTGSRA